MIQRNDRRDLRVILGRFVRPHAGLIVLASCLGLLAAVLNTAQPLVLAPIIDSMTGAAPAPAAASREITLNNVGSTLLAWTGQGARPLRVVVASALAYVGLVALTSLVGFLNLLLVSRVRTHLFGDLQESGYRHLLGLSMSYFVRQRTGALGARLTNDAFQAAVTVEPIVRGLIPAAGQLVLLALLLMRTDAGLTAGILAVFLIHLTITWALRDRIRLLVAGQFDLFADLASRIHETVLSIRVVKSFGAERFELTRFIERSRDLGRMMRQGDRYKDAEMPLREIVDAAGLAGVILMASAAYTDERLSISGFVLFIALARKALAPASWLAATVLSLQTALGSAGRLLELLNEKPEVTDGSRDAAALREGIRVDQVHFAYEGHAPVLQDVSLELRRGEVVALVGRSGAGKSTLADLILRLYDPSRGQITWDGVPIRDFRAESYRRRFGVVSQEALVFNATVTENIAYGRPIDRASVAEAARMAHADEFIRALPHGYGTAVGDRGIRLSGGQRQRLAIARALYENPDVLMLDEATSALDAESEAIVQEAIVEATIAKRVTTLVIAHRLSTVVRADRIVVLDAGRIEAVGTHHELLVICPLYARLCRHQLQGVPEGIV